MGISQMPQNQKCTKHMYVGLGTKRNIDAKTSDLEKLH